MSSRSYSVRQFAFVLSLLCVLPMASAQLGEVPSDADRVAAGRELARLGVDEAELVRRLAAKGIDVTEMSVEELAAVRPVIEATVAEIQAESAANTADGGAEQEAAEAPGDATESRDDVREAVRDGASVEEAEAEAESEAVDDAPDDGDVSTYGHQLFRGKTLEVYRASDQAKPPNSYTLDSGDELAISIFGASQTDLLLEIGDDGFLKPPGIPRIYLRGRRLGEAQELVKSRLSEYYVFGEGQFSLNVDVARTISVSVYGEVEQSGTYSLSALNGPLNALVAAGGPTERGSVRNIRLIRGETVVYIDVYRFLSNPGVESTINLREGDIINVPLAEEVVRIQGGVRRPMAYELLGRERIDTLITYAGGLVPGAVPSATRVVRLSNGELSVIDVDADDFAQFDLRDGDVVEVPTVSSPISNFVEVTGQVLVSGRFGYTPGMQLRQVLDRAQIRPSARRDVAFVRRRNDDGTQRLIRVSLEEGEADLDSELRRGDVITVLPASRFIDDATFTVRGAVRDRDLTVSYPQDGKLTVAEAILLAGGLEGNAVSEVLIIRTPTISSERREYLRLDITEATTTEVEPFDQIVVYAQERFEDAPTVSIAGAVRLPAQVRFDESLGIDDLLYLAGGASFEAAADRVEVYRLSLDGNETRTLVETLGLTSATETAGEFALRPYDEVYVRRSANFEPIQRVTLEGEVTYPGAYARIDGQNRLSDFVARAGGLTDEAFAAGATLFRPGSEVGLVVLDLEEVVEDPSLPSNLVLRAGDRLEIPKPQEVVTIYTANTNAERFGVDSTNRGGTIRVAYQGPKSAKWYIDNYAGGFNDERAEKRSATVRQAAGGVAETSSFLGIRRYPRVRRGGTVRVDRKEVKPPKPPRERSSWSDIAQVTIAALSAVATILVVATRFQASDDE